MAIKLLEGSPFKDDKLTNKNTKAGTTFMVGYNGNDTYVVNNIAKNWTNVDDKGTVLFYDDVDNFNPDSNDTLIVKNLSPNDTFIFFDVGIKNTKYSVQSQISDELFIVKNSMIDSVFKQTREAFYYDDYSKFKKGAVDISYYFGDTNNWNGSNYGTQNGGGYINTIQITDSKGAKYFLDIDSYVKNVQGKVLTFLKSHSQYQTAMQILLECDDIGVVGELINIYKNEPLHYKSIEGSSKSDTIHANNGNTIINSGKGNDIIYAGEGVKTIDIVNGNGNDTIYLGEEHDTNLTLLFDENSELSFGKGVNSNENDLYIYSKFSAKSGKKTVIKTETTTIKNYFNKTSNLFINGVKVNTSYLASKGLTVVGLAKKDNIMNGIDGVNQTFVGGNKADTINTGNGNNTIKTGSKGSTVINSQSGNDTYIVSNLKTYTNISDAGGNDSLQIKSTKVNDITLYYDNEADTLRISDKKSISKTDKNNVTINNFISSGIENVKISDNEIDVLSWLYGVNNRVSEYLSQKGVSSVNELMSMINTMSKKNKSKALTEFYNVILTYKRGTNGNDKIIGTSGNDTIYGEEGNDTIKGGKGNDYIIGGKGNDKLYGEKGSNTFEFNKYDGNDTIYKTTSSDVLKFADVQFDELTFSKNGNNLDITNSYGDKVTLDGFFKSKSKLDNIYTYDSVDEPNSIKNDAVVYVAGNTTVKGTAYDDIIQGGSGNDKLYGEGGDNVFVFNNTNSGSDTVYSGKGTDVLLFKDFNSISDFENNAVLSSSGNSLIIKYTNSDSVTVDNYFKNSSVKYIQVGEEKKELSEIVSAYAETHTNTIIASGTTINGTQFNDDITGTTKADVIKALAGDDIIKSGKGNDKIYAGTGKNKIYIYEGDGKDTIYTTGGGSDLLVLEDRYSSMLRWTKSKNDLVFTFTNTDDKITLADFFKGSPSNPSVRQIKLADGYIYNISDICKNLYVKGAKTIKGTIIGDNIFGSEKADTIYGYDGDDVIYSYGGKDIIYAGNGKDQIFAGRGDNIIYAGDGDDYISTNLDELNLVSRDTVYAGAGDGEIELGYAFNTVYGEDGADTITSFYANEAKHHTIYAGAGEDRIELSGSEHYIDAGDDKDNILMNSICNSVIIGGKGNDEIQINSKNGIGNNTLQFTTGDGNDVISGSSTFDGSKILFTDTQNLSFERSNYWHLKINYGNSDSIILRNYFQSQDNYEAYPLFESLKLQNGEGASIKNLCQVVKDYFEPNGQQNAIANFSLNQIKSETANWMSGNMSNIEYAPQSVENNVNDIIAQYSPNTDYQNV